MAQKYRKFMRETKRIIAEQVWRRIKWAVVVDWHTIRVRFEDGKEDVFTYVLSLPKIAERFYLIYGNT